MKKLILSAIAVFAFTASKAQEGGYKPVKGTLTTEVGVTGGVSDTKFGLQSSGFSNGFLKFRYFLKDDLGLRLGFGPDRDKTETITGTTTTTNTDSNFALTLGAEKHFTGSDRLSTYAGGDIVLAFNNTTNDVVQDNGNYTKTTGGSNAFGIRLVTGADYYFVKKVYLGVELGLEFLSVSNKDIVVENRVGNTVTSTSADGGSSSNFKSSGFGGVRIGYQF